MTVITPGSPFGRLKQDIIPVQRVRITSNASSGNGRGGWDVEYLPVGKSRWWWNWRVYRTERTEQAARLCADMIIAERTVTLTSYANDEVEL